MSTLIETSTGTIDYTPAVGEALPPRNLRDAWKVVDDGNGVITIEIDMTAAKAQAHELRRKWRSHVDTSTFDYDWGAGPVTFNKDMMSVARITGAVQMATIQDAMHDADPNIPVFATAWTDASGVDHPADKSWIIGLFMSMGQHTQAVHTENGVKWQAIEDAQDVTALQAVTDPIRAALGE